MECTGSNPNRLHLEHRRSFSSRAGCRPNHLRKHSASRLDVLFLSRGELYAIDLRSERQLHFVTRWRSKLDCTCSAGGPDDGELAAEYVRRSEGGRVRVPRIFPSESISGF